MGVSFLAMLAGVIIRLTAKKQKWWYKTHHGLGYVGVIGAVTLFFVFASFIIILFFKAAKKEAKKGVRITHRVAGWVTLPLMIATIFLGLQIAGLI